MNIRNFFTKLAALIFFTLSLFSIWVLSKEIRYQSDLPLFASSVRSDYGAFSLISDKYRLSTCLGDISSANFRLMPEPQQKNILRSCQTIAGQITDSTPSNGFGWFVLAFSSHQLNQWKTVNIAMQNSYKFSPNEIWLARLRVRFSETILESLYSKSKISHQQDLALLLLGAQGIEQLVRLFRNDRGFRLRFSDILKTQTIGLQRAFIFSLKQSIGGEDAR